MKWFVTINKEAKIDYIQSIINLTNKLLGLSMNED